MGVLLMLIGITFVTVGCDQANKAEIDLGRGAGTYSYTLSGSMLKIADLQLEAKKVSSPTEAQIKAAQNIGLSSIPPPFKVKRTAYDSLLPLDSVYS